MPYSPWWRLRRITCLVPGRSPARVDVYPLRSPPTQVGWASWYGPGVYRRSPVSGEPRSRHDLTPAYRTLPLGIKVLIHHLKPDAHVGVTITDRGPSVDPRHRMPIH